MVWVIGAFALVVFALAAVAATGRLGEMPPPVDGVYPGRFPSELTTDTLSDVRFARQLNGYDPDEVDSLLARVVGGELELDAGDLPRFGSRRIGYQRRQVGHVVTELSVMRNNGACNQSSRNEGTHGSDEATHR